MERMMAGLNEFESRNIRWTLRLLAWTVAWVASLVVVDKAVLYGWVEGDALLVAGVILNAALGLGVIFTFRGFLAALDELQRRIQLEALALTTGAGIVGSFTYNLLTTTGFIVDHEVKDIMVLMCVVYVGATVVGQLRYR